MKRTLRLFAVARQWADAETIEIDLPSGATVGELRQAVLIRLPNLAQFGRQLRFAVNSEYADDATPIALDAEIACIPPVSGG